MDEGVIRIFAKEQLGKPLGTKVVGRKIYSYDVVSSTNTLAHELARKGEPEGSVVFAKGQTEGRGRFGRSWASPCGVGLYFSLILRPAISAAEAPRLTLVAALAVAKGLEAAGADGVAIKWPNDILMKGKKVCGILTELCGIEASPCAPGDVSAATYVQYAVVGVGVNVNASLSELPDGATSLKEALAKEFDLADLSHAIMKNMDSCYDLLLSGNFSAILAEVKERSALILGGRVKVACEGRIVEGYAVDFDACGGLVIRRDSGMMEKIYAGTLLEPVSYCGGESHAGGR